MFLIIGNSETVDCGIVPNQLLTDSRCGVPLFGSGPPPLPPPVLLRFPRPRFEEQEVSHTYDSGTEGPFRLWTEP